MLQVKKNTILDMKLHSIISASIKKCNLRTFEAQKKANWWDYPLTEDDKIQARKLFSSTWIVQLL